MNLQTILHADAFENEKDFLKSEIEKIFLENWMPTFAHIFQKIMILYE